jgi:hypothetical protein
VITSPFAPQQRPLSTVTGTTPAPVIAASAATPGCNTPRTPGATRVPCGKITIERPAASAPRAAVTMPRSAGAAPARSTGIIPAGRRHAPNSGIFSSSCFSTKVGAGRCASRIRISSSL